MGLTQDGREMVEKPDREEVSECWRAQSIPTKIYDLYRRNIDGFSPQQRLALTDRTVVSEEEEARDIIKLITIKLIFIHDYLKYC